MTSSANIDVELNRLKETDTVGSSYDGNDDDEDEWLVHSIPNLKRRNQTTGHPSEGAAGAPQPRSAIATRGAGTGSQTKEVRFATAPETSSEDGAAAGTSVAARRTTAANTINGFRSAVVLTDSTLHRRAGGGGGAAPVVIDSAVSRRGGDHGSAEVSPTSGGGGDDVIEPFHTRVNRHRIGGAGDVRHSASSRQRSSVSLTVSTDTADGPHRISHNLADDEGVAESQTRSSAMSPANRRVVDADYISLSSLSEDPTPANRDNAVMSKTTVSHSRAGKNDSTLGVRRQESSSTVDSRNEPIPRASQPSGTSRVGASAITRKSPGSQGQGALEASFRLTDSSDDSPPQTKIKSVRVNASSKRESEWWNRVIDKKGEGAPLSPTGSRPNAMSDASMSELKRRAASGNTTTTSRLAAVPSPLSSTTSSQSAPHKTTVSTTQSSRAKTSAEEEEKRKSFASSTNNRVSASQRQPASSSSKPEWDSNTKITYSSGRKGRIPDAVTTRRSTGTLPSSEDEPEGERSAIVDAQEDVVAPWARTPMDSSPSTQGQAGSSAGAETATVSYRVGSGTTSFTSSQAASTLKKPVKSTESPAPASSVNKSVTRKTSGKKDNGSDLPLKQPPPPTSAFKYSGVHQGPSPRKEGGTPEEAGPLQLCPSARSNVSTPPQTGTQNQHQRMASAPLDDAADQGDVSPLSSRQQQQRAPASPGEKRTGSPSLLRSDPRQSPRFTNVGRSPTQATTHASVTPQSTEAKTEPRDKEEVTSSVAQSRHREKKESTCC